MPPSPGANLGLVDSMSRHNKALVGVSSAFSGALLLGAALIALFEQPVWSRPAWELRLAALANLLDPDRAEKPGRNAAYLPPQPSAPHQGWSHYEVELALMQCMHLLARVRAEVVPVAPIREGDCGTPAPVLLRSLEGKAKIDIDPPLLLNCPMVAALSRWLETTVQTAAQDILGSPVVRIVGSSYSCRTAYYRAETRLSQHGFANAIDLPVFVLANGQQINIAGAWGTTRRDLKVATAKLAPVTASSGPADHRKTAPTPPNKKWSAGTRTGNVSAVKKTSATDDRLMAAQLVPSPSTPQAKFLRRIHEGACGLFSTVLGPEANEAHRHHLHLDLQERGSLRVCR